MKLKEKIIENIENAFETGALTLGIFCKKCGKQYSLDEEVVTLAAISRITLVEYFLHIQSSMCPNCEKKV